MDFEYFSIDSSPVSIGPGNVLAISHKEDKTTANEVKEKTLETYEAMKSYTWNSAR